MVKLNDFSSCNCTEDILALRNLRHFDDLVVYPHYYKHVGKIRNVQIEKIGFAMMLQLQHMCWGSK